MNISCFSFDKLLGKGSYGCVYKCIMLKNNKTYAIKKIDIERISQYEKQNIITELRILASHRCPFIVKFKTAFVENNSIYFVTEFATFGDLSGKILDKKKSSTKFEEDTIWNYFLQLCIAVSYLHRFQIIHRDIKPANVFIDSNDNIKLGDFGISKIMKTYMMFGQTRIGTPLYMSPELYRGERHDHKTDMWALGCLLFELMTLKPAFYGKNIVEIQTNIIRGKFGNITDTYSTDLHSLLKKLINIYQRQRICINTLLKSEEVVKQLKIRDLLISISDDISPSFYLQYSAPKNIIKWTDIINMFVNINSTIKVQDDEQQKIEKINNAKINLKNKYELIDIEDRLGELCKKIGYYKTILNDCENMYINLEKRKKEIMHTLFSK